jgi:hypothetical protein
MKKYLPLIISTILTTAFVVVKKTVIPALPGLNKILNGGCNTELDGYNENLIKPYDQQAKENNYYSDSLTSFLYIRKYTFQNHPLRKDEKNYNFSYQIYRRIGRQYGGNTVNLK